MKKFYPAAAGKLCLSLILSLSLITAAKAQIVTYDTTFDGWNAIVTEDLSLRGTDSAAGIVFFPGIGEQTTNINEEWSLGWECDIGQWSTSSFYYFSSTVDIWLSGHGGEAED